MSSIADRAKNEKKGIGFDAAKMEGTDMVKAGIIDPAKVTRSALQNAAKHFARPSAPSRPCCSPPSAPSPTCPRRRRPPPWAAAAWAEWAAWIIKLA